MKKQYIQPSTEVIAFDSEYLMMNLSTPSRTTTDINLRNGFVEDDAANAASIRRIWE